jgi:hypothetical protein
VSLEKPGRHFYPLCATVGLLLGLGNARWQVSVETGQVLAGLTPYGPENPWYMYHVKVFSLVNHLSALLMALTENEIATSLMVSGLVSMVSILGLGTLIFALCGSPLVAIAGAVFIAVNNLVGEGVVYPIALVGLEHTYGMLGMGVVVLAVSLLPTRRCSSGLFLAGVAPAVHPSWGMFLWAVLGLSALWDQRFARSVLFEKRRMFLLGLGVGVVSLLYQLYRMRILPDTDPATTRLFAVNFAANWDFHRTRFDLFTVGVLRSLASAALCGVLLRLGPRQPVAFLCRVIVVATAVSLVGGLITWLPPELVPSYVMMFMPGRYVNMTILLFPALLIGMLTNEALRNDRRFQIMIVTLATFAAAGWVGTFPGWGAMLPGGTVRALLAKAALLLLCLAGAAWFLSSVERRDRSFGVLGVLESASPATRFALLTAGVLVSLSGTIPIIAIEIFMRGRVVALAILLVAALPMGMLALKVLRDDRKFQIAVVTLATFATVSWGGTWLGGGAGLPESSPLVILASALLLLIPLGGSARLVAASGRSDQSFSALGILGSASPGARLALLTACALVLYPRTIPATAAEVRGLTPARILGSNEFLDRTNDDFYRAASAGEGLLVSTNADFLISLKTRRRLFFDPGALDGFTMVPESGPTLNPFLQDVYGVDLLSVPPEEFRNAGVILPALHRRLWEERTEEEWVLLRRRWGISDVITPAVWRLDLPIVAEGHDRTLFEIPSR